MEHKKLLNMFISNSILTETTNKIIKIKITFYLKANWKRILVNVICDLQISFFPIAMNAAKFNDHLPLYMFRVEDNAKDRWY